MYTDTDAVPHRSTVNTHSDLPLTTLQSRFKYWVAQKLIEREIAREREMGEGRKEKKREGGRWEKGK